MKHLILLLLCCCSLLTAGATVPVRYTRLHIQPDGTKILLTIESDGHSITYTTADGLACLRAANGHFYYALQQDGSLRASHLLAHEAAQRNDVEQALVAKDVLTGQALRALIDTESDSRPSRISERAFTTGGSGLGVYGESANGSVKSIGTPTFPVVMVEFADKSFKEGHTMEKISRLFNEKGYNDEDYSIGSVRDYYIDMSNGLFAPTFEVVAKVRLSRGYAYYGANASSNSLDTNLPIFVQEALDSASKSVDFSAYATSGRVPMVSFMYAGPGEHSSFEDGSEDYLWARFSSSTTFKANDGTVTIASFFVGDELLQYYKLVDDVITPTGSDLDGIGLFCHEFSHALGLPDVYYTGKDTSLRKSLQTPFYWDLMDYGQYMLNGYYPPAYQAYQRSFLGWLDVKELTDPEFVTLYPAGQEDLGCTACVIRNPENKQEFFIFENRQDNTWYHASYLGTGLHVTHVDYASGTWNTNTVNNDPDRLRIIQVPADGKFNYKIKPDNMTTTEFWAMYQNDLFPGPLGVTDITPESNVSLKVYTAAGVLDKPIYNITETPEKTITFKFLDPTLQGITDVEANRPQTAVAYYSLDGQRLTSLRQAAPGVYIEQRNGQPARKVLVK